VSGDVEVAVEPRVQKRRPVYLDFQRPEVGGETFGVRLEVQPGRVGVCSDDAEAVVHRARRDEGDECAAASDEAPSGTPGEVGQFARVVEPHETSVEQAPRRRSDHVVRGRRRIEEGAQIADDRVERGGSAIGGRFALGARLTARLSRLGC